MRRFFALLLCGLVLLSTGCAYAAVSSQRGEGDYELFFREADLTGVPGGDALRAEIVHLEEEQRQDPQEVARILLTALRGRPFCRWNWMAPWPGWICPRRTGAFPASRWRWRITPLP